MNSDKTGGEHIVECHSPCSGRPTPVEGTEELIACSQCGRVGRLDDVSTTHTGTRLFSGGAENNCIRIIGMVTIPLSTYHMGKWAVIKSPYEARDDLIDLPEETTGRQWSDELSAWVVQQDSIRTVKNHLSEQGWDIVDFVNNDY